MGNPITTLPHKRQLTNPLSLKIMIFELFRRKDKLVVLKNPEDKIFLTFELKTEKSIELFDKKFRKDFKFEGIECTISAKNVKIEIPDKDVILNTEPNKEGVLTSFYNLLDGKDMKLA